MIDFFLYSIILISLSILIGRWIYIGQAKNLSNMKDDDIFEILTKWKGDNFYFVILKNTSSEKIELWKLAYIPNGQYIQIDRAYHGGFSIKSIKL